MVQSTRGSDSRDKTIEDATMEVVSADMGRASTEEGRGDGVLGSSNPWRLCGGESPNSEAHGEAGRTWVCRRWVQKWVAGEGQNWRAWRAAARGRSVAGFPKIGVIQSPPSWALAAVVEKFAPDAACVDWT
ncbi:hypothetical protein MLD38_037365 [Melastoma candidum]|uniref:Uncharacterized protein n=1 Tax=Melastoma candidum TaxID=119954 RepID=A0ACB9LPB1_9MYRT|nr:hypothetical protein MLD38_037365 [Melastoma candidum]